MKAKYSAAGLEAGMRPATAAAPADSARPRKRLAARRLPVSVPAARSDSAVRVQGGEAPSSQEIATML